jgi:putative transposase
VQAPAPSSPRAELVVDALEPALQRRRPDRGLVHHSDQGSQYVSLSFGRRCRQAGIEQSMGGRRSAYDNAVCESFFKTLKSDLIDPEKAELRTAIFDYIESFYNRQRRHSILDYLSPAEYEEITTNEKVA